MPSGVRSAIAESDPDRARHAYQLALWIHGLHLRAGVGERDADDRRAAQRRHAAKLAAPCDRKNRDSAQFVPNGRIVTQTLQALQPLSCDVKPTSRFVRARAAV